MGEKTIKQFDAEKKLIISVSDGMPLNSGEAAEYFRQLKKSGISACALAVNDSYDELSEMYPICAKCDSSEDIHKAILDNLNGKNDTINAAVFSIVKTDKNEFVARIPVCMEGKIAEFQRIIDCCKARYEKIYGDSGDVLKEKLNVVLQELLMHQCLPKTATLSTKPLKYSRKSRN